MKKSTYKLVAAAVLFGSAAFSFAERAPVYISPNNDGTQDMLVVPIQIKEKRYLSEWTFIVSDAQGNVVRTIGNKEKRPEKITFKNFFKSLVTPKKGVEIPSEVIWNGVCDDGSIAKDGTYFYKFGASDDNGNSAFTKEYKVVVDNTAPSIELKQPGEQEKIFGEGAKSVLKITQSGSVEDMWTAYFADASGNPVRKYVFSNGEPMSLVWDGADDSGNEVPDGIYTYKISATDKAGNTSENAVISNIIFSAEKPVTSIAITSAKDFSPNGDGVQDTINFALSIPKPQSKSNALSTWSVKINDTNGKTYRTYTGTETAPSLITFDGKADDGSLIPEGNYVAVVNAKYLNGYEPAEINSPVFNMDITKPTAQLKPSVKTFSPDGDGNSDTVVITQTASVEKNWKGTIFNEKNLAVKTYDLGSTVPNEVVWDGSDNSGKLVDDGIYYYVLSATDNAGNYFQAKTEDITLDTSKTEVILTANLVAFSPNGDKVQDTITFTPTVKTQSGISQYTVSIVNKDTGKTVKSITEKTALPSKIEWNGLDSSGARCPDGTYFALLATKAKNGSDSQAQTQNFILDTKLPEIKMSVPYTIFSPDGDGKLDSLPITVDSSYESKWTGILRNSKGTTVREWVWQGKVPGTVDFDGTDEMGNVLANGSYSFTIESVDAAGNRGDATLAKLTIDTRETKAYVTAELAGISPNGDGNLESQKFNVKVSLTEGIANWRFAIEDIDGNVAHAWTEKDSPNLPAVFKWNGAKDDGSIGEGTFVAKLHVEYAKGNVVDAVSSPFLCSATPPLLRVRTAPEFFSPDNDGINDDLYIQLKGASVAGLKNWAFVIKDPENGKAFWKIDGKSSITERIIWDGRGNNGERVQSAMDYPYEFTATDELGMSSKVEGIISVDVLVIRVGNVLKMQVPSIIFRGNAADFKNKKEAKNGLEDSVINNNKRVLKRIAEILNKFKDYTVTIEGHANNTSGLESEEAELTALSQQRAEFVLDYLAKNGVDRSRLSAVGRGGTAPVVERSDKDNWWKNRRVEFILNK